VAHRLTGQDLKTLESMIEQHSISECLDALGQICFEKAEHIRVNGNDRKSAKTWEKDTVKLVRVSASVIH
jgi:hypothetical protein